MYYLRGFGFVLLVDSVLSRQLQPERQVLRLVQIRAFGLNAELKQSATFKAGGLVWYLVVVRVPIDVKTGGLTAN